MNKIKLSTPLKLNKDSVSKLQESQITCCRRDVRTVPPFAKG
ncbi:class I lanthipeptide [Elizabethkingia anophelis]